MRFANKSEHNSDSHDYRSSGNSYHYSGICLHAYVRSNNTATKPETCFDQESNESLVMPYHFEIFE